jgi:hypothetical protein
MKQKCMYCSTEIRVSQKGHLIRHLENGAVMCVGSGFRADQMKIQVDRKNALLSEEKKERGRS